MRVSAGLDACLTIVAAAAAVLRVVRSMSLRQRARGVAAARLTASTAARGRYRSRGCARQRRSSSRYETRSALQPARAPDAAISRWPNPAGTGEQPLARRSAISVRMRVERPIRPARWVHAIYSSRIASGSAFPISSTEPTSSSTPGTFHRFFPDHADLHGVTIVQTLCRPLLIGGYPLLPRKAVKVEGAHRAAHVALEVHGGGLGAPAAGNQQAGNGRQQSGASPSSAVDEPRGATLPKGCSLHRLSRRRPSRLRCQQDRASTHGQRVTEAARNWPWGRGD